MEGDASAGGLRQRRALERNFRFVDLRRVRRPLPECPLPGSDERRPMKVLYQFILSPNARRARQTAFRHCFVLPDLRRRRPISWRPIPGRSRRGLSGRANRGHPWQGNGIQKRAGIRVLRRGEDMAAQTLFDDPPASQDIDPVAHRSDHREVVADEGHRKAEVARHPFSRFNTWACVETSSPETISSARTKSGASSATRAMPTRCRCPPESSCGYRSRQADGRLKRAKIFLPAPLLRLRSPRRGGTALAPGRCDGSSGAD